MSGQSTIPTPRRQPAPALFFKLAVATLALTFAGAYAWRLFDIGAIKTIGGAISIRTGDYFWQYRLGFATVLQGCAALLFILFAAMGKPGGRPASSSLWQPFMTAWAALALAFLLAYAQLSGTQILMPFFTVTAVLASGAIAFMLARPGRGITRLEVWTLDLSSRLEHPRSQAWTQAALTALTLALAITACRHIYMGHPLVTDSQSQIAQARLLLAGQWRLDISQPLRDVIAFPYATPSVPSFSQYPPGHILLLLPVLAMGLPAQALNFAAGALTVLLVMRLARRLYGAEAMLAAGMLMAASPFVLVMNGGAMNHVTTACLLTAAAVCLMPSGPGQTVGRGPWLAFLGGVCLGWAAATRPLTGAAHGLVWAGFAIVMLIQGWRRHGGNPSSGESPLNPAAPSPLRTLGHGLLVTLGVALPAAVFLFYNWKTTGHPLTPGYLANNHELHQLGFRAGGPYPYSPIDAVNNLAANGLSLNALLLGWPIGSLAVLAVWLIRARLALAERLLIALAAVQTAFYALYHFHDLFLGPRFLFDIAPLLILLAAGGLASILKARDFRAGVLWLVILIFSASGCVAGLQWWQVKHNAAIAQHEAVVQFLKKTLPPAADTVIILREPAEEMIGRQFSPPLPGRAALWFVPEKKEARARELPELQGFQWLYYPPRDKPNL